MRKTCFVIIGYGIKTDFETGREINLDKTYTNIIKPVFKKLEIKCFRSSDLKQSGVIDVKMYEHILKADFVVADISTLNANAIYELGIRHALRPNTTIILCEDELINNKRLPFDINHVTIHTYKHHGKALDFDEVKRFKKHLNKLVKQKLEADMPEIDSPVYTFLPTLNPPVFTNEELKEIMEIDENEEVDISKLLQHAEEKKNENDYDLALDYLEKALALTPNQNDSYIVQKLALYTYKSQKPTHVKALNKAKKILKTLNPEHTTDPETLGLMGAINKRLYSELDDEKYLNRSLHFYERGYYVKQDYYNGINLAFLYAKKASISQDKLEMYSNYGQAMKLWKDCIDKLNKIVDEENFDERDDKEWVYLTFAEANLGLGNLEKEQKYFNKAQDMKNSGFAISSYTEQKGNLEDILTAINQGMEK